MSGKNLAATAAAVFAAGLLVAAESQAAGVKCVGSNACKGTSACKSANSSCKGQNSCKALGWVETADAAACAQRGGKVAAE